MLYAKEQKMSKKLGLIVFGLLSLFATSSAEAVATCTSKASGRWTSTNTWTCTGTPVIDKPDAAAIAIIASPHTVTLAGDVPVSSLIVNTGATLNDANKTLTITGDLTNNGTITGGGDMDVTGSASIISGVGTYTNSRLFVSGLSPQIAAGAVLNFSGSSRIYTGRNQAGTTVRTSVLTINGTINSSVTTATDFLRPYADNTVVGSTGVINASVSSIIFKNSTAKVTNNGSVSVKIITQSAATNGWTQGINSNLTVTAVSTVGVLTASASGNTVTYNLPAKPILPPDNTYWNLAGTGACPHAFTILGTSPCTAAPGTTTATANPGTCSNTTDIGAFAWAPSPTTNVNTSDDAYATATNVNGTSNYLKCTGYGFAIPTNATILGITIIVERKSSSTKNSTDAAMRLVKAGTIVTAVNRAKSTQWNTTTDVSVPYGGMADLWGTTWTPADINATDFGAAFAAKTTNGKTRTISVDHMPITVTYSTPSAAPHHIQIDHDGQGQTCRAETLTVTACDNALCTAPFTSATVTGNVTWAGTVSGSGTLPFTITNGGTGQTTVLLPVSTEQTVTISTSAISPTQTNPPSTCVNADVNAVVGEECSLVFKPATVCFDAVEVGATNTALFTKLSGTPFMLDVLTGSTYSGTPTVELVNAATGNCATHTSLGAAYDQKMTFSSQTRKTTTAFNYPHAVKKAKIRITGLAGSSCSSGTFAIRPQSLSVTSSANSDTTGTSVSALPVIKAGNAFTLTATAPVTGYDGIPVVDNLKLLPHSGAVATGTLAGAFSAANPTTGVATGTGFTYDEVGYFKVDVGGVYDDSFTEVDALAGDCTNDFSNTAVGGKYGCKFRNTAASSYFGRFIPDHFAVIPADFDDRADLCSGGFLSDGVTPCASIFTYMGEELDANFVLAAQDKGGNTTQNYTGTFAKLNPLVANGTLSLAAIDTNAPTNLTSRLDTSVVALNGTGSFSNGSADMVVPISINRGANADGPYTAVDVGIAPVDSDGVTTIFDMDINNDTIMDRTQVNANSTELRYGRSRITNAYGSGLAPLSLPIAAEYWNGQLYITNGDDDLSSLTYQLLNYQGNLQAGETTMTVSAIAAGLGQVNLSSPGFGNEGSVDVSITAPTYLPKVANGRATFGVASGKRNFIYRGRRGR